jgi:hypothetical protein
VKTVEELMNNISKSPKRLLVEGFYPGYDGMYQYPIEIN